MVYDPITIPPRQNPIAAQPLILTGVLAGLGCFYLGSWLYFKINSRDFIMARRETALVQRRQHPSPYLLGKVIDFSGMGQSPAARYQVKGWSHAETWGTWTEGPEAELALRLQPQTTQTLRATVRIRNMLKPADRSAQQIDLLVNGRMLDQWSLQASDIPGNRMITIPPAMLNAEGRLLLAFRIHHPVSPLTLGINQDSRLLGIGIQQITISAGP